MGLPKADRILVCLLLVLAAGFAVGVSHLMKLRFNRGDVYPAYSSLRSDPLGCRVFYDSLDTLESIRVTRNLRPLQSLEPDGNATLFLIGVALRPEEELPLAEAEAVDDFISSGGRVVVTLRPILEHGSASPVRNPNKAPGPASDADGRPPSKPPEPKTGGDDSGSNGNAEGHSRPADGSGPDLQPERPTHASLEKIWGITLAAVSREGGQRAGAAGYAAAQRSDLPEVVPWHSQAYFASISGAWETLFSVGGRAVMIERRMGDGSLVLATDSYLISNEALKSERFPELLAYLIGGRINIVVDETHHGVRRQLGVIGYLRRHRLHWILIALLSVAGLFVWRNAVPLVPPATGSGDGPPAVEADRSAAQGLTNLLRRHIPPGKLLDVCLDQWERAYEKNPRFPASRRERAKRAVERTAASSGVNTDPVRGYRTVCRVLAEDRQDE